VPQTDYDSYQICERGRFGPFWLGWKEAVPARTALKGMTKKKFDELFRTDSPKAFVLDSSLNLLQLTPDIISGFDALRVALNGALLPIPVIQESVLTVFVAHSSDDIDKVVEPLKRLIEGPEIVVRLAQDGNNAGRPIRELIHQSIKDSDVVAFVLTANSLNSYWALHEVLFSALCDEQCAAKRLLVLDYWAEDLIRLNGFSSIALESCYEKTIRENMENHLEEAKSANSANKTEILEVRGQAERLASLFLSHASYRPTLPVRHPTPEDLLFLKREIQKRIQAVAERRKGS
jgi:hypothetical protein